eukprot:gene10040-7931_t
MLHLLSAAKLFFAFGSKDEVSSLYMQIARQPVVSLCSASYRVLHLMHELEAYTITLQSSTTMHLLTAAKLFFVPGSKDEAGRFCMRIARQPVVSLCTAKIFFVFGSEDEASRLYTQIARQPVASDVATALGLECGVSTILVAIESNNGLSRLYTYSNLRALSIPQRTRLTAAITGEHAAVLLGKQFSISKPLVIQGGSNIKVLKPLVVLYAAWQIKSSNIKANDRTMCEVPSNIKGSAIETTRLTMWFHVNQGLQYQSIKASGFAMCCMANQELQY